jgi:hypothetical protein
MMNPNLPVSYVTVGYANQADAFTAAQEAALKARQQLPTDLQPGWLLAFAGGQHDPAELLRGFQAALGTIPVIGGCGTGIITAEAATNAAFFCSPTR